MPDTEQRQLVPSPREERLGVAANRHDFRNSGKKRQRKGIGGAFRDLLSDLNLRNLEGPKAPILILGFSGLVIGLDDLALATLFPEIRADLGISLTSLGVMSSIFGVLTLMLGPALGYLADRVKRVWLLRAGALVANSASVLQASAGGIPQFMAGRALNGLGGAISGPAHGPLLADYYPSGSRARAFAFKNVIGYLHLPAPIIVGTLGVAFGWRVAVYSLAILALGVSIAYFFLKEPRRGYWDRIELGASEEVARKEQRPVSWKEGWRASLGIVTLRRMCYAMPFVAVGGLGLGLVRGLYFAGEFGLDSAQRAYLETITQGVGLLGLLVAGPLADRMLAHRPGRVVTAMGWLMIWQIVSLVVLVFSRNLWVSTIVGMPLAFANVALGPATFTIMSLVVPARVRGLAMQVFAPFALLALFIQPLIFRAVDEWGPRLGILAFAPVALIGGVIFLTSGLGVERDIRNAKAASLAEEESEQAKRRGKMKMLVCRDVDVAYDEVQVLFNVDFDLEEGEMVALLGTNGAGKSTLLRAIAGVEHVSNGAVFFDGDNITHAPAFQNAARGVTFVPGSSGIFPTLSVNENLRMATGLQRKDKHYTREQMAKALKVFPVLKKRLHSKAGNLSGGEQRMLTLAQALMMKPRLLLIDELSFGLAPSVVEELLESLKKVQAEGASVVLVEQSVNLALRAAPRAVFMEKGEIRFDGPSSQLLDHPELLRSVFMAGVGRAVGQLGTAAAGHRPSEAREQLLQAHDLSVNFGGVHALEGAGLDVRAGEIVGVIGPNGAGKTTLFDVLSGFVEPDRGWVALGGKDVTRLGPDARARRGLGRAFQNVRLFPVMTVRENIMVAREGGTSPKEMLLAAVWAPGARRAERIAANRAQFLMELMGLQGVADKFLDELSTGTRRAVEVACMMAAEPKVVLLDEPSAGLAQAEAIELGPVLARIVRESGCGMIIIEHNLPLVTSISDRLVAMDLGRVIATGKPGEVLVDPKVVASYLGGPAPSGNGKQADASTKEKKVGI